jgi:hypothetical protein
MAGCCLQQMLNCLLVMLLQTVFGCGFCCGLTGVYGHRKLSQLSEAIVARMIHHPHIYPPFSTPSGLCGGALCTTQKILILSITVWMGTIHLIAP